MPTIDIPILEAGVRGAAMALLLLLAALLLRDGGRGWAARLGAAFAVGGAATLVSAAPPLDGQPYLWLLPFQVLNLGNPAVFWLLASALFDDDFALGWPHAVAWLGLVSVGLWSLGGGHVGFLAYKAGTLLCICAALVQAIAGRAGDLVEARRTLRVRFIAIVGVFTAVIVISALFLHGGRDTPAFGYTDAIGNLVISALLAITLLSLGPSDLLEPLAATASEKRRAVREDPDPREAALLSALRRQMDDLRVYREEDLNIADLAARLGVPEYRLRRMINQHLDHRNFSAFLNGYRLEDVIGALADPAQDEVPILTIALDAGFASIGVFNRAFKARTGMTPTEFRRARTS